MIMYCFSIDLSLLCCVKIFKNKIPSYNIGETDIKYQCSNFKRHHCAPNTTIDEHKKVD